MFGFILGTACLIGFIAVYRSGRGHRFGSQRLRWLFRKLDTSPGQERVVRNAFRSIKDEARNFAAHGKSSRRELAELLRAADLDVQQVSEWFVRREEDFKKLRESSVRALGEVHEVLDDAQREQLAQLVERAGCWPVGLRGGPYRQQAPEAP